MQMLIVLSFVFVDMGKLSNIIFFCILSDMLHSLLVPIWVIWWVRGVGESVGIGGV